MLIAVIILSVLLFPAIVTMFVMGDKISDLKHDLKRSNQQLDNESQWRREDSKRYREEDADHYKRHAVTESALIRLAIMFGLEDNYKGRGGFNLQRLLHDLDAVANVEHRKAAKKRLTPKK